MDIDDQERLRELAEVPHLLSLGAGVQSSTLALMAAAGEVTPMPTAAIFADTQAEPDSVYKWLDWLEKQLPFPVHRVTAGSLQEYALALRKRKIGGYYTKTAIPYFTLSDDGVKGHVRHRTCTVEFKIRPITKAARRIGKVPRGCKEIRVVQWVGISLDEISRMKRNRDVWIQNRWPLVEKRMTRRKCLEWMETHGYPQPPRSACVFCPFHSNAEWRRLKDEEPEQFERAVQFELVVQAGKAKTCNFASTPFLHRSCVPLDEVDLRTDRDHGQLYLWQDECEGMCGV